MKTHYFVCLSLLIILTDIVRCEPGYSFNLDAQGWLKLHKTPQTWQEAFDTCHDEGALLASPLNKILGDGLKSQMKQHGVTGYILLGIHDFFNKGVFTSLEGVPLSAMDIRWGSCGSNTGDCLIMSVNGSVCQSLRNTALPFICYKMMKKQMKGYHHNQQTGSCYKIHYKKMSWSGAYSECASEGAHLVILNDANETRIVRDVFPAHMVVVEKWDGFHIGLVALGKKRNWITIHGERIDNVYNKWHPGEPNNLGGSQDRGLCLWNGHLDDVNKDSTRRTFVCEKSPKPEKYGDLSEFNKMCDELQ